MHVPYGQIGRTLFLIKQEPQKGSDGKPCRDEAPFYIISYEPHYHNFTNNPMLEGSERCMGDTLFTAFGMFQQSRLVRWTSDIAITLLYDFNKEDMYNDDRLFNLVHYIDRWQEGDDPDNRYFSNLIITKELLEKMQGKAWEEFLSK